MTNTIPSPFSTIGPPSGTLLDYELVNLISWPQYYPILARLTPNIHPYAGAFTIGDFVNNGQNPIGMIHAQDSQFAPEAMRNIIYQSNGLPIQLPQLGSFNANMSGMHANLVDTYWTSPITMYYRDFNASGTLFHRPFAKPTSVLYDVPISSGHKDAIKEHPELRTISVGLSGPSSPNQTFLASGHMLPLGYEADYITQIQTNLRFMFDNPHNIPIHPMWTRLPMTSIFYNRSVTSSYFGGDRFWGRDFLGVDFSAMGTLGLPSVDAALTSINIFASAQTLPSGIPTPNMTFADNMFLNNIQGRYTDFISMGDNIDYLSPGSGFPVSSGFGPVIPDALQQITYPVEYVYNLYGVQKVKFIKNALTNLTSKPSLLQVPGQLSMGNSVFQYFGSSSVSNNRLAFPQSSFAFFPPTLADLMRKPETGIDFWTRVPLEWSVRDPITNLNVIVASGDWRYPPNLIEFNQWVSEFDTIRARFSIMTTQPTNLEIEMDFINIPAIPVQGDVIDRFGNEYPNRLQYEWRPYLSYQLTSIDRTSREKVVDTGDFNAGWTNTNQRHVYAQKPLHKLTPSGIDGFIYTIILPSSDMPMDNHLSHYNYDNSLPVGSTGLFTKWAGGNVIGKVFWMNIGWRLVYIGGSVAYGSMVKLKTEEEPATLPIPSMGSLKVNGRELTINQTIPDSIGNNYIRVFDTSVVPTQVFSDLPDSIEDNIITVRQQGSLEPPTFIDGINTNIDDRFFKSSDFTPHTAADLAKITYTVIKTSMTIQFTIQTFWDTLPAPRSTCGAVVVPRFRISLYNGLHEILMGTDIRGSRGARGISTNQQIKSFSSLPLRFSSRRRSFMLQAAGLISFFYAWQDLYFIIEPIPREDYSSVGFLGGSTSGPSNPCGGQATRDDMLDLLPTDAESYPVTIDRVSIVLDIVDEYDARLRVSLNRTETIEIVANLGFTVPGSFLVWDSSSGPLRNVNVPPVFESYWDANAASPLRIR